jgi:hypothetical protein
MCPELILRFVLVDSFYIHTHTHTSKKKKFAPGTRVVVVTRRVVTYRDLIIMIIFTLYFFLCSECVILYKINCRQNCPWWKHFTGLFEL